MVQLLFITLCTSKVAKQCIIFIGFCLFVRAVTEK